MQVLFHSPTQNSCQRHLRKNSKEPVAILKFAKRSKFLNTHIIPKMNQIILSNTEDTKNGIPVTPRMSRAIPNVFNNTA